MRRVHVLLGLAAVSSCGFVLFTVMGNEERTRAMSAAAVLAPEPEAEPSDVLSVEGDEPAALAAVEVPDTVARATINPERTEQEADPCAEIRAEFEASEDARRELSSQLYSLKVQVKKQEVELQLLKHDETTPLGAFFRSDEAKAMSLGFRKSFAQRMQEEFPVFLRPWETTWIADRIQNKDSRSFGGRFQQVVIRFLGPQRVLAEAPPSWVEEQKRTLDDQRWFELFGTPKPE